MRGRTSNRRPVDSAPAHRCPRCGRPVEGIRAEFAAIAAHSLQNRVPVPDSDDEVASPAETMTGTPDQLRRAVGRGARMILTLPLSASLTHSREGQTADL